MSRRATATAGNPGGAGRPSRSVSFRVSLLRSVILLILALSIAILTVSTIAARRAVRTLCQDLVFSGTDRLEIELRRYFEPIPRYLFVTRDWSRKGLYTPHDPERMLSLFGPFLEKSPQVSSLNTGNAAGDGFMLLYDGACWRSRTVAHETLGRKAHWRKWDALDGAAEEWTDETGDDPRAQPWFQAAAAANASDDAIFWTEPYTSFATNEPGITASIRARDPGGDLHIIAADLLLKDISRITSGFKISPNGFVIVTTNDVRAVGLPGHPDLADEEKRKAAFLKHPRELGIPLVTAASEIIRERFNLAPDEVMSIERGLSRENRPFRWKFEGNPWWAHIRPCIIENGPQFWIGVAVPEDDFLGELREGRRFYYGFAGVALLVAAFVSSRLAHRYSTPIRALIEQSDRLRTLNTGERIEAGRSGIREIEQLNNAQERMRLALDSFAKYVPSDVVRDLLERGEAAVIGGRSTSMTILFTDIKGFTSIAEAMTPAELTRHMASYFDAMLGIIQSHAGTVDKLIGDAIVAFWSAPVPNAHHARDAVRGALACHQLLQVLNKEWRAAGLPALPTRFGISTGDVVVGNVGSPNRLSYTALGDAVNLASRLEGLNTVYGSRIIASQTTVAQAGDEFLWRRLDKVRVKGRAVPELIYELLGEKGKVAEVERARARQYEAALDACLAREFEKAFAILLKLAHKSEGDASVARLAEICRTFADRPPPADWDGVSEFKEK